MNVSLLNPPSASSQIVAIDSYDDVVPFAAAPASTVIRVTVTDPNGNAATQDVAITMT